VSWASFIASAARAEHAVQVYDDPADLVAVVVPYLAAGLSDGSPALVIATPERVRAIAAALPEVPDDLLTMLDADETLAAIVDDGAVARDAFERVVGGAVAGLEERFPDRTIRAFGEMVDLLWQRGDRSGALDLEELWNALQRTHDLALLCAYCVDVFDVDAQANGLGDVFRLHTHGRPVVDTTRLSAALDRALADVVGPARAARVYLDVADHVPRGSVPRAQAVIGWLCANDRTIAADVLGRARAYYA
jgi:hypothetical protein